jgi:hypothetical protein
MVLPTGLWLRIRADWEDVAMKRHTTAPAAIDVSLLLPELGASSSWATHTFTARGPESRFCYATPTSIPQLFRGVGRPPPWSYSENST